MKTLQERLNELVSDICKFQGADQKQLTVGNVRSVIKVIGGMMKKNRHEGRPTVVPLLQEYSQSLDLGDFLATHPYEKAKPKKKVKKK